MDSHSLIRAGKEVKKQDLQQQEGYDKNIPVRPGRKKRRFVRVFHIVLNTIFKIKRMNRILFYHVNRVILKIVFKIKG